MASWFLSCFVCAVLPLKWIPHLGYSEFSHGSYLGPPFALAVRKKPIKSRSLSKRLLGPCGRSRYFPPTGSPENIHWLLRRWNLYQTVRQGSSQNCLWAVSSQTRTNGVENNEVWTFSHSIPFQHSFRKQTPVLSPETSKASSLHSFNSWDTRTHGVPHICKSLETYLSYANGIPLWNEKI